MNFKDTKSGIRPVIGYLDEEQTARLQKWLHGNNDKVVGRCVTHQEQVRMNFIKKLIAEGRLTDAL